MKALFLFLVGFSLTHTANAQEAPKVGAAWQHQNGSLEVVLFPNQWPENCVGFHVIVASKATGKVTLMNREPMLLAIRKDRDMAGFTDDPELAKLATAAGNKRAERFAFDPTPEKLAAIGLRLLPSLVGLCKEDPLLLYAAGLRVGKKLPAGEYTLTVEAEGSDGAKRQMLEISFDSKVVPKPETEPDFSVEFSLEGFQAIESEFLDPYFEAHTAFWMFCGLNRATKQITTFGKGAPASRKFSKRSVTTPIGDANPDHYIFGIQTTDWFGNKDVYLKKNAGK